ncbi:transmembrane protein 79-like [Brachionichthys hirsutus]|uniref:transmembrane protein 79-like n=1 Tax=Brachionichthys hirsutus TaxID=412623 RepID=UPI0036047163
MDDGGGTKPRQPSTLQWPGDRQAGGQTGGQAGGQTGGQVRQDDGLSVRSDNSVREAASWTESERELLSGSGRRVGGAEEEEGAGLMPHLEEEEEEKHDENHLPDKAAQVFSPAVTVLRSPASPRHSDAFWEVESEKSPFLGPRGVPQDYNHHGFQYEWREDAPASCVQTCLSRGALKWGVSLMMSALFFPFLVWGGFVFLPFDAPFLDSAPSGSSTRCAAPCSPPSPSSSVGWSWASVGSGLEHSDLWLRTT